MWPKPAFYPAKQKQGKGSQQKGRRNNPGDLMVFPFNTETIEMYLSNEKEKGYPHHNPGTMLLIWNREPH